MAGGRGRDHERVDLPEQRLGRPDRVEPVLGRKPPRVLGHGVGTGTAARRSSASSVRTWNAPILPTPTTPTCSSRSALRSTANATVNGRRPASKIASCRPPRRWLQAVAADGRDDRHRLLERLLLGRRVHLFGLLRRDRCDRNPDDRRRGVWKARPLWRHRVRELRRESELHRGRPHVGSSRGWRSAAPSSCFRPSSARTAGKVGSRSRRARPSSAMPAPHRAGAAFRYAGAQHHGQAPGHPGRRRVGRGRDHRGRLVNATVSFSVPQAIACAATVERGLRRREAAGPECRAWHRSSR